jgi:asparagine synthase (glutamine-hydrolysing)
MYQHIPRVLRRWAIEPAIFAIPISVGVLGKAQRYIRRSNAGNPERYCPWRLLQVFPPDQVLGTAMDWSNGNGDLLRVIRAHYKAAPAHSELNRLLYIDIKMTLGDEDLPKVVRTSELAGISVRFPYLDHPLAEFTGRVPASLKVRGLEKRYLFKRATRDLLPEAILKKKKHGFGLPIGFWLKTDSKLRSLSREVLLDPKTYQRGYFRREFIERLFASLEQDDTPYFGDLLWVFLMLEFWHRRHVEGTAL